MPPDTGIKLVNYILGMQDLRFGLTVSQVRQVAFTVVEAAGKNHLFKHES
jgi:hypothetical protein